MLVRFEITKFVDMYIFVHVFESVDRRRHTTTTADSPGAFGSDEIKAGKYISLLY